MESTLERELNVPEIVADQAIGTSLRLGMCSRGWASQVSVNHGAGVCSASGSTDLRSSADTYLQSVYAAAGLPLRGGRPVVYHFADILRWERRISSCVPPPEGVKSI